MRYLFDERGRCVMIAMDGCSDEFIKRNSERAGSVACIDSDYIGGLDEVYNDKGQVKPRPNSPAILEGLWLRRVPVPATIYINGTKYPSQESSIELSFPYPSTYTIRVEAFPYKDATFSVTTT